MAELPKEQPQHKIKLLKYAKEKPVAFWNNVLWTDENQNCTFWPSPKEKRVKPLYKRTPYQL